MRESSSVMTENAPAPTSFILEREPTLNDFRDRKSARLQSRKSSAARSIAMKCGNGNISRQTTATLRYHTELSNMNIINVHNEPEVGYNSPQSGRTYSIHDPVDIRDENFNEPETDGALNDKELVSTSSHIHLNGDIKHMLDNEYANYDSEGGLSVRTPPRNLQIKDLMIPLDDWGSKEHAIREKKYAVLPSIHSSPTSEPASIDFNTARNSIASNMSINNQLDFFRDKIEQEADFFADFRVNTSKVKATPRQDPLPPIKNGTSDKHFNPSHSRASKHSSKNKSSNKPAVV